MIDKLLVLSSDTTHLWERARTHSHTTAAHRPFSFGENVKVWRKKDSSFFLRDPVFHQPTEGELLNILFSVLK